MLDKKFSKPDVDMVWSKVAGKEKKVGFPSFLKFLQLIAERKGVPIETLHEQVLAARAQNSGTKGSSKFYDDKSKRDPPAFERLSLSGNGQIGGSLWRLGAKGFRSAKHTSLSLSLSLFSISLFSIHTVSCREHNEGEEDARRARILSLVERLPWRRLRLFVWTHPPSPAQLDRRR